MQCQNHHCGIYKDDIIFNKPREFKNIIIEEDILVRLAP